MESLQGQILLAAPALADPNFRRTVVLLLQHNDEGALGLVLNRSTRQRVRDVLEPLIDDPPDTALTLYIGGPVKGPLIALHAVETLADMHVMPGVFASSSRDALLELMRRDTEPLRVFTGYSGWGAQQLEHELGSGAWITAPATVDNIFYRGDDDALWRRVADGVVRSVLGPALRVKHVPPDVSQN